MADTIVRVYEEETRVIIYGSELLAGLVTSASDAATSAEADADRAEAAATTTEDVRLTALVAGSLPIGWIDPTEFDGIEDYATADFDVKLYSNGLRVWAMMPDVTATRSEWRSGGVRVYHPDEAAYYVSIRMGDVYDPIRQGIAPTVYYVNGATGNDTTGDGSSGTPWKTITKALAVINASGDDVFDVRLAHTSYVGNGSAWDPGTYTLNADKWVTITGTDVAGEKLWVLNSQRNSYLKATFAWQNKGNGIWLSAVGTGTIAANAKSTPVIFDLSVLDADGAPSPCKWLEGPYADEAAILAAMAAEGPCWHVTGTDQYVKLDSLAEPDPGVNFAYTESATGNVFQLNEGSWLCIRNVRAIHNGRTANSNMQWRFRPETVTLGVAEPNPQIDARVSLVDVEIYGPSGNGFQFQDIRRGVMSDCRDAFCWLDGVNQTTFYTYPANTNTAAEGADCHAWVEGHVSRFHSTNLFRTQPSVTNSDNGLTGHARTKVTAINGRFEASLGSNCAFVSGSKCLVINCNFTDPKYVTPTGLLYQANYLAHGAASADSADGSEIWAIYCTGRVARTGYNFYAEGSAARIIAVDFRGIPTSLAVSSAIIEDGYGNAL